MKIDRTKNNFEEKYPKVLIFEHPPINKNGIGKTLYSFFYNWDWTQLGQVYSVDLPLDEKVCQYFYYPEFFEPHKNSEKDKKKREKRRNTFIFKIIANLIHSNCGTIVRSIRYKKRSKNYENLDKWIDKFNPACLFYGVGENVNENLFVLEIAQRKKLPIILYASDDYIAKWCKPGVYSRYGRKLFESYEKLIEKSILFVVISDKMKSLYQKKFPRIPYLVASNSSECKRSLSVTSKRKKHEIHFIYTGNLGLGRWKMLKKFAEIILRFNSTNNYYKLYLSIYSQEQPTHAILSKITNEYSTYHDNVVGEELDQVRCCADVLLLVESFSPQYKGVLSTAMSTKVPEYLSYGKMILAWAPSYAGSMEYLANHNAAFCVSSFRLVSELENFVEQYNKGRLNNIIKNGNKLFDEQHEFYHNADRFSACIKNSLYGKI